MTTISVEISFPYGSVFKYSGPAEQLAPIQELFSKWVGRASSVCFSNSKRQTSNPTPATGSSKKKRKRRPKKGRQQGDKKPGKPAVKQPAPKQPPPAKACKCTECNEDFTSHSARKKHFNVTHKPGFMEVETPRKKAKRKAIVLDSSASVTQMLGIKRKLRKHLLAKRNEIDESEVKRLITASGNKPGNYRINFQNRSGFVDINDYSPSNGSFGLSGRGYTTILKPSTGLINDLLKDGLNSAMGDAEFYKKYNNILKKDDSHF